MKKFIAIQKPRLFVKVLFIVSVSILTLGLETLSARSFNSKAAINCWSINDTPLANSISYLLVENIGDPKCTNTPTVTTLAASAIDGTSATLNGIVNPNQGYTNYYFNWGTTTSYGNTTPLKYGGAGSCNAAAFSTITGLTPGTTYHFQLVAINPLGTSTGIDMFFVAGNLQITTTPVSAITSTTAVSGGYIAFNGGFPITSRGICWGLQSFPTISGSHTSDGSGDGIFTSTLTGLSPATVYHIRAYAINSEGVFYGSDITFTTASCGGYNLPYSEDFSAGVIPDCWSQLDNQGNAEVWQAGVITNQTPNPLLNGNYAFLNSSDFGSGSSQNVDLISPAFDLSTYSSITLQFNHFILSSNASAGTLSYSTDNGSSWVVFQTFTSTSVANPEAFSQVIDAISGHSQVKFRWNYTGSFGSYWAIDDIQISGLLPPPSLTVTPINQDVLPPSGTTTYSVTCNTEWTATSEQTWCLFTPSGTGNGTITATYAENNTNAQRLASIYVTATGLSPVVVTLTQAAPTISVTPDQVNVSYQSGTYVFTVTSNAWWTLTDNQPWCTATSSGTGNGTINATYTANTTTSPRIVEISVNVSGLPAVVVSLTQAPGPPGLSVTPALRTVPVTAGSTTFSVTSNTDWTASSDQPWCTCTPSGTGNGTITASYTHNSASIAREAHITVSATDVESVVLTVSQAYIESGFLITAQNLIQTSPSTLEFDVYLLDTDPTAPFEFAAMQFGFLINSDIHSGGTLTLGIDNSSSGLPPGQQPIATAVVTNLTGYPGLTVMKVAGRLPAAPGYRPIISTIAPGTQITHFIISSSVPFSSNSTANLVFISNTVSNPLYPTRLATYINGVNTQLDIYPGINAVVEGNPVLNGPPVLEIIPGDQVVQPIAGNVNFAISSNTSWIAQTDEPWVTITPSGYGNGTILATFTENISEPRSAAITVFAEGQESIVILNQEGSDSRTLNLSFVIEGLYAGNGTMKQAHDLNGPHFNPDISDLVTIELHNSSDYSIIEHAVADVELSTLGNLILNLPQSFSGSYYITVRHRNSIETTTANPVTFDNAVTSYAFDAPSKAYGSNLLLMNDGHYAIISGDVNQDGFIDTGDMTPVDNDSQHFASGYLNTDVNGDGYIDTGDMSIIDNNSSVYIVAETP